MRLRISLSLAASVFFLLFILLDGCSREPTPEEKHADSTLVLAKDQLAKGMSREARRLLQSVLALDLKLNRTQQIAEEYSLLGNVSTLSAEFDSAIAYYSKAIGQYKSLTDRANARALMLEIASLHRQMGEERIAFTMYTEALRFAKVFNDVAGMREIQFAMLPACRALENTEDQATTINDLLKAYMESGDHRLQARPYYESALSFLQRHEYQQAVEQMLRALTLADQVKDSQFVITILATLATTYDRMGNTQQAFETYTDALTRSDRTSGMQDIRLEMLIRIGNIYLRNSNVKNAGRFYRAALSSAVTTGNKLAEGYLFVQLGHCALGEGRRDEALKSVQNAMELFTPVKYSRGIAYANLGMGMIHQRAGRPNDALVNLKAAVEQMELCAAQVTDVYGECEAIVLNHLSYYDPLIELLFHLGRSDEAFWYAERKSERLLFEELNALDLRTRSNDVNVLLNRLDHERAGNIGAERQLAKTLAHGPDDRMLREEIAAQIQKANDAFRETALAILRENPRLEPAVQFAGATIAEVQRLVPQGTVFLRCIPTHRSVYSFAITNSRTSLQLAAIDREHMRRSVAEYAATLHQLEALSDSPAVQRRPLERLLQELSTQLYAALIRPVETTLAGAGTLIIALDPELIRVPFHALRKGGWGTPYCIEKYAITYIPTVAMLRNPASTTRPVHDIVALGFAGTTAWDVEYELRDIRAFYKDARLYFGLQAALGTLQRERADILHLACDLRFSGSTPANASILLSDGKNRGAMREVPWGDLLSTSIFRTVVVSHLRADSIGIDQLLPSLFLLSGSSSVIVNMHPASRKAKKYYGEILYTTLLAEKPAESGYRQALLEMIKNKEYAAPYYWAPFSLWGK